MKKFDLHTHTTMSDGTFTPTQVVEAAAGAGLALVAITDHDTTAGVKEALEAGRRLGMPVLPGLEFDVEFDGLLHILALGVDVDCPVLGQMEEAARVRREWRNAEIIRRITMAGVDLAPHMEYSQGMTTRLNIAKAIVQAGGAATLIEAFDKYLRRGCVGNVYVERPSKQKVISAIHEAGGLAVLAHPCKLKCDPHPLISELAGLGLDGLEAFYPSSTLGQTELFCSLAAQHGLLTTCGSDFHGGNRSVELGEGWQPLEELEELCGNFLHKYI